VWKKAHWSGFCRSGHFERSGVWKIMFKKREKKVKKTFKTVLELKKSVLEWK